MVKVDLHTHSVASPDGAISAKQYEKILSDGTLDCVAVTDHNRIDFAVELQKHLGEEKIIVGEEITTLDGEIIGLFLVQAVNPNQSVESTIKDIHDQGGLVYIPHPFETVRNGITRENLERITKEIDIIESANGRAYFQNFGPEAHTWSRVRGLPVFASSDAHHASALGKTFSLLRATPNRQNLAHLTQTARKIYVRPNFTDVLAPKLNRLKKLIGSN